MNDETQDTQALEESEGITNATEKSNIVGTVSVALSDPNTKIPLERCTQGIVKTQIPHNINTGDVVVITASDGDAALAWSKTIFKVEKVDDFTLHLGIDIDQKFVDHADGGKEKDVFPHSKSDLFINKVIESNEVKNLVTTLGKNAILDSSFGRVSWTSINCILKGVGPADVTNTLASHSQWLEVGGVNAPQYDGSRPPALFTALASNGLKTMTGITFMITSTGTVAGIGLIANGSASKDDPTNTGTLISVADFSSGVAPSGAGGLSLTVNYSFQL